MWPVASFVIDKYLSCQWLTVAFTSIHVFEFLGAAEKEKWILPRIRASLRLCCSLKFESLEIVWSPYSKEKWGPSPHQKSCNVIRINLEEGVGKTKYLHPLARKMTDLAMSVLAFHMGPHRNPNTQRSGKSRVWCGAAGEGLVTELAEERSFGKRSHAVVCSPAEDVSLYFPWSFSRKFHSPVFKREELMRTSLAPNLCAETAFQMVYFATLQGNVKWSSPEEDNTVILHGWDSKAVKDKDSEKTMPCRTQGWKLLGPERIPIRKDEWDLETNSNIVAPQNVFIWWLSYPSLPV